MENNSNKNIEIVHPILVYPFLFLLIIFSMIILNASKRGIRITRYLNKF